LLPKVFERHIEYWELAGLHDGGLRLDQAPDSQLPRML